MMMIICLILAAYPELSKLSRTIAVKTFKREKGKKLLKQIFWKVFDGRGDCSDWSDECPTQTKPPDEDIFSSRYELIANPILRILVWIMGVAAICGNLVGDGTWVK